MRWHKDRRVRAGGWWACLIRKREYEKGRLDKIEKRMRKYTPGTPEYAENYERVMARWTN